MDLPETILDSPGATTAGEFLFSVGAERNFKTVPKLFRGALTLLVERLVRFLFFHFSQEAIGDH